MEYFYDRWHFGATQLLGDLIKSIELYLVLVPILAYEIVIIYNCIGKKIIYILSGVVFKKKKKTSVAWSALRNIYNPCIFFLHFCYFIAISVKTSVKDQ